MDVTGQQIKVNTRICSFSSQNYKPVNIVSLYAEILCTVFLSALRSYFMRTNYIAAFSLSMAFRLSVHTNSRVDQLGFNSWQEQEILLFSGMMM